MNTLNLDGALTALVTPFTPDDDVDYGALESLVQSQIDAGISGLVPCGTTGESPTLSDSEKYEIIRRTVIIANGRVPVIAGAGCNDTAKTIRVCHTAINAGANAVMIVMPYYNKPTQEGMFQHVTKIASQIGRTPIILYNIPGRSVVDLSTDTLARIIDETPNVIGVKDATGNVLRCQQVARRFGGAISVLSGDDALTPAMMACGACGVISVTSNIYPKAVARVCSAMNAGNLPLAQKRHFALMPVHDAMFIEPNPVPVKYGLSLRKQISFGVRLPMVPPTDATRAQVAKAMEEYEGLPE
ncbi:MAG: 4-hydroxy-tetrahydrodipicolinate synthase [Polyangiaceae bacterium]|nr:4-hydroxy-tetrahydrodipicolinate synthase [Polyangiaceae bacterium]